jgi:serine/threonine protein kinase
MKSFFQDLEEGKLKEIGRGGYGIIYLDENKKEVIKFSKHPNECEKYKEEYNIQKKTYNCYKRYFDKEIKRYVKILEPYDFLSNNVMCAFKMPYINTYKHKLIQTYFAEKHYQKEWEGRGIYFGLNQLTSFFKTINFKLTMSQIIFNLGYLIGFIQYVCKQTANDTEIVVDKNGILYMIDFGESKEYIEANIDVLSWPLYAEFYYPFEDSKYYVNFERGYLKAAKQANMKNIAINVLKERE